jgi:putative DNA primase/helicase
MGQPLLQVLSQGRYNNPSLTSEMSRRVVPIELDANAQRPWLDGEKFYKHEPLLPWIKAHRNEIVWAVLVIIQNWISKGCPEAKDLPALGSYEEYRRVIGGILQAAGVEGFLGNLKTFYESSDGESAALEAFVHLWWETFQDKGVGVNELYPLIRDNGISLDLGKKGTERSETTALGKKLPSLRNRRIGRYRILQAGTKQRAQQYRLFVEEEERPSELQ